MEARLWDNSDLKQVFGALSNSRRLKMLVLLMEESPLMAEDLSEKLQIPYKTANRNLDILRKVNLIISETYGGNVFYSINDKENDDQIALLLVLVNMAFVKSLRQNAKAELSKKLNKKMADYMAMSVQPTLGRMARFFGVSL